MADSTIRKEDPAPKCPDECTCMMDRFMLYGGKTDDVSEAAALYLGNSYLVQYAPGDPEGHVYAAITKAFIDGAYWNERRKEPREGPNG